MLLVLLLLPCEKFCYFGLLAGCEVGEFVLQQPQRLHARQEGAVGHLQVLFCSE
jgi:hypothetical protein